MQKAILKYRHGSLAQPLGAWASRPRPVRSHYSFFTLHLIKEVPRQTEAEDAAIGGIMRRKEILPVATATIHMTHHDEETGVLEMHVGIHIHKGITTNLHT